MKTATILLALAIGFTACSASTDGQLPTQEGNSASGSQTSDNQAYSSLISKTAAYPASYAEEAEHRGRIERIDYDTRDYAEGTGRHVLNTAYTTNKCNDNQYFGEPCYYPEKYPLQYGVYEGTGKDDPDYGRSIAVLAENLHWTQRDYLDAVPLQQIRLNPALTQNPGW